MEFKNRVFIGDDNKPYMAQYFNTNIHGEFIMIFTLHPDNKWVSHKSIPITNGKFVPDNLSEEEQASYPTFHKQG